MLKTEVAAFTPSLLFALGAARAPIKLNRARLPVNVGVVLLEPAMTQDQVLVAQTSDCKQHTFRVTLVALNDIQDLSYRTFAVNRAVNIEDRNTALKLGWSHARPSHEVSICVANTRGARINKRIGGHNTLIKSGLELHTNVEGISRFSRGCRRQGKCARQAAL
jgi:hypothetical protein